jgi:hypothetical protein
MTWVRGLLPAALAGALACTDPDTRVLPVDPSWMEWPAQVAAGVEFPLRVGVWQVCAVDPVFQPGAKVSQAALTLRPYFLAGRQDIFCATLDVAPLDTVIMAPALAATAARTYEVRGARTTSSGARVARLYGTLEARPAGGPDGRTMAAGYAAAESDGPGCVGLRPTVLFEERYVVENPPAMSSPWFGFVTGYLYHPASPVCGATTVFHLESHEAP